MYKSSTPQDAFLFYTGATTYSGNGAVTWANTGLAYIDTFGLSTMTLQIVGAHTSALAFQESNDLTTWVAACLQSESSVPLAENTSVTNGQGMYGWQPRARYFRINITGYTSSPTLYVYGKAGTTPPATQPVSAIQDGTWTVQPGNTPNTSPWLTTPAVFAKSRVTADGQISAVAGRLHTISIAPTTATPTAGLITVYDSLSETGTIIYSEWVFATTPGHTIIIDSTITTGIYVGYDGTAANISVTVTYS